MSILAGRAIFRDAVLQRCSVPSHHARYYSWLCHEPQRLVGRARARSITTSNNGTIGLQGEAETSVSYGLSFGRPEVFDYPFRTKGQIKNPVKVQIGGLVEEVSPILLRDLCSCSRCVDPSTKQKSFATTEIPAEIEARSTTADGDNVSIEWTNDVAGFGTDHTSQIPLSVLHHLLNAGTAAPRLETPQRVFWDAQKYEKDCPDVDYQSYMSDDKSLFDVVRQLHSHGLAFVTNVPESEASVSAIAERIGPLKTTFYGHTWDVRSVPQAINVAYTSSNLGFHMDLLYMEQPPHIQLLHCIRASSVGGASLFTDSFKAAIDLAKSDPAAYEDLVQGRIDFHYDHPGSQYYHQARRVIETKPAAVDARPEDSIDAISWSPPFQAPFALSPLNRESLGTSMESWHEQAQKFDSLIHRPDGIYERIMKPGECVLFDNRRVLHARRAFEVGDLGKERWLRGAYIDKDPFMSSMKILTDRYGQK